ncbi:hypothetical protein NQ318_008994 [Aromia moschata]|uniref:Uncharacterized protein n=1 Tax=Aromia moschata TaxID=1265417 RepID=A0AAV8XEC1_9CUCU|nr:hypothetical protein NQ318_008994 [Aromia moschata]
MYYKRSKDYWFFKCAIWDERIVYNSFRSLRLDHIQCFQKIKQKKELEEKKQNLSAELTQLQNRHSQLTISLKNQKTQQDQLLMTQETTEHKIKQILNFIENMKKPLLNDDLSNELST